MKINVGKTHKKATSRTRRADVIAALEEIESREKARLKISIPYEAAEKLDQFLKEKGLPERQGIPMLIHYGLSEESEEELEKLKSEKESQIGHLWGTYATMKFRAYEYFTENKALTMRLSYSLSENLSLKRRLENMGLRSLVPKDEWDGWNEETVESYFRRYVFASRL